MTGNQLQKILDGAGLTQVGAAYELDIGARTMRGYISGERPIPRTFVYALRWLIHASERGLDVDTGSKAKK
jgi:hypothetical protein